MGFDLYGVNPEISNDYPKRFYDILRKWGKGDHLDYSLKIPKKVTEEYFDIQTKFDEEHPGRYFRNNVWWWRPLWNFVCEVCDDFLKDKDMAKGDSNSGYKISKTKATKISKRLFKEIANGNVDELERYHTLRMAKAQAHNKEVRKELDRITKECKDKHGDDLVPRDYPEPYKTQWKKTYDKEDWAASYPFNAENVKNFAVFCQKSGGFTIC